MALYIEKKFISLLSSKLSQFKKRADSLWNFRCPLCGDSHRNKVKARGYVYEKKGALFFMCHNCGASMSFPNFLKVVDPHLFKEYLFDKLADSRPANTENDITQFATKPVFKPKPVDINLPSIDKLALTHPARKILTDRQIPKAWYSRLYYAEDFAAFVQEIIPENDKKLYKEARIVIPYYDKDGNLLGFQGRAMEAGPIKYITMKTNEDSTKIFGWNYIDTSKNIYVVEGPIDSMFLDNAVATMDASLYHAPILLGVDLNYTFVYDNEPRNKQIVANMRKTIEQGKKLVIWPDSIKAKDINEMILSGMSSAEIMHIIDKHTYSGIKATMQLNQWSKL